MKKGSLIAAAIICLFISMISITEATKSNEPIHDLMNLVNDQGLDAETWQVTLKEKVDRSSVQVLLDQNAGSFDSVTENVNAVKYIFGTEKNIGNINSKVQIIVPKEQQFQAEIIGIIEGTAWDQKNQEAYDQIQEDISAKYFTEAVDRFVWLSVENNDIINDDEFLKKVKSDFNMQLSQSHLDTESENRKDVYGYIPHWDHQMVIGDESVNFHVNMETNEKGNQELIVGTPILINEY